MTGKVWLVGAGPGDPRLITVRGLELLRCADAVVYDRLVSAELVEHAPSHAERFDVGKARGHQRASQKEITALLICLARAGRQVVRLKGGDPFVFGRGGEEALALEAAGIIWEVVPGISAAIAAPALAGIPLTQRDMAGSFAVTTGHVGLAQPGLTHADTLVVLMAVDQLENIVGTLLEQGRIPETPAALVQAASTAAQHTVRATLGTLIEAARHARIAPPATLVVGPTVALSQELNRFERRPLFGRRVLLARTRTEASELAALLLAVGAEVHELPVQRVVPLLAHSDRQALKAALQQMADAAYDWVLFGGASSVHSLWAALETLGLDARAVRGRVAALGVGTSEALRQHGVNADWCTTSYQAADVAAGFAAQANQGACIFWPFVEPMPRLVEALAARGASLDAVAVGQVETDSAADSQRLGELLEPPVLDLVVLPASGAVDELAGLLQATHRTFGNARVVCIGPKTAERARAVGWPVHGVADHASRAALVDVAIQVVAEQSRAGVTGD
jgi:uroporphyrinogen III methyltransferase / synthase